MGAFSTQQLGRGGWPPQRDLPELNIAYLIQATLSNLEQLFNNAEKIKEQYGLALTITEKELKDIKEIHAPKRLFGRKFINDTANVYSRRNNVWKKVKWAATDEAGLRLLLKDIGYFNKRLESLLHPVDRSYCETNGDAVMRSIVTRSPDKGLLDVLYGTLDTVDGAIAAAARLKQRSYVLELIKPSSNSTSGAATPASEIPEQRDMTTAQRHLSGRSMKNLDLRKDYKQLAFKTGRPALQQREIAFYEGTTVIVE